MKNEPKVPARAQVAKNAANKGGRKRRITELFPEQRASIQPYFHRGLTVERIAEELELDVSPVQLLEHVVRVYTGAKHPGPAAVTRKPDARELNEQGRAA
jgi:hypothetical protein